jgi:hypothetical protein
MPLSAHLSRLALLAAALLACPWALGQSFCASDGQPQPVALLERFINADCEACWADGSAAPQPRELALDWILPGGSDDAAPLSAAASRDGLARLEALRRQPPAQADAVRSRAQAPLRGLRVAHGLPFNGYLGTSIELKAPGSRPWTAWLLLVETIPAGTEGTPIERNLVRNALQPLWSGRTSLSKKEHARLFESRPMSIPPGAQPERLRVLGWVQDARGRIRAIAQSRCVPTAPGG